jgi:cytochrome c
MEAPGQLTGGEPCCRAVLVASANLRIAQDIDQGAIAFKKCAICHKIGSWRDGIGPELNGLIGRLSGSVSEFNYFDPNKNAHVVWNEEIFG